MTQCEAPDSRPEHRTQHGFFGRTNFATQRRMRELGT